MLTLIFSQLPRVSSRFSSGGFSEEVLEASSYSFNCLFLIAWGGPVVMKDLYSSDDPPVSGHGIRDL